MTHLIVVPTATATEPEIGQTANADGLTMLGKRYTVIAALGCSMDVNTHTQTNKQTMGDGGWVRSVDWKGQADGMQHAYVAATLTLRHRKLVNNVEVVCRACRGDYQGRQNGFARVCKCAPESGRGRTFAGAERAQRRLGRRHALTPILVEPDHRIPRAIALALQRDDPAGRRVSRQSGRGEPG